MQEFNVTIANGASLSGATQDLAGKTVRGLVMPATWTAANLTFQGSHDNSTFNNLYEEDGTEVTITADAARFIQLPSTFFQAVRFLKVRSGTAASAVNQGGSRIITLLVEP